MQYGCQCCCQPLTNWWCRNRSFTRGSAENKKLLVLVLLVLVLVLVIVLVVIQMLVLVLVLKILRLKIKKCTY